MADDNLKDFGSGWVQLGLLTFCLITFATIFMAANNPIGLGDAASAQLGIASDNLSSNLLQLTEDTDSLLNISANTNPTEGYLGSRDSVASSYGIMDIGSGIFTSTKTLISWVFAGVIGEMLLGVFGGLVSLIGLYWVVKWIRNGF